MTLPTTFTELLIEISKDGDYSYTFHVLTDMLTATARDFANGYRFTANTNAGSQVAISLTTIRLRDCYYDGVSVSDANMTVYYK